MVVICFQISIFDTIGNNYDSEYALKIAVVICFQISIFDTIGNNTASVTEAYLKVVICFQISIFDTIGNNKLLSLCGRKQLWFAFKLVSLIPLETTMQSFYETLLQLWFAFKLVSLIPLETTRRKTQSEHQSCDLLSN